MIGYDLVPQKYHKPIGYNLETKTVENRIIKITHHVEALGIQFLDFADNFSFKYELPQLLINPKEIKSQDFLLEGHYLQIWAPPNWKFLLPFSGEGDTLNSENNIRNTNEMYLYTQNCSQGDTDNSS